jgi:hypothetical protein
VGAARSCPSDIEDEVNPDWQTPYEHRTGQSAVTVGLVHRSPAGIRCWRSPLGKALQDCYDQALSRPDYTGDGGIARIDTRLTSTFPVFRPILATTAGFRPVFRLLL